MKKTSLFLILSSFSLLLIGCTWTAPTSVAVKTQAVYNFGIGEIEKDFADYFTSDKILATATSTDNSRIYDYYPDKKDGKIQKYLMKLPIQEIAVDFTEYFNSTKLAEAITDLSFSKDVTVPEMKISISEAIPLEKAYAAINAIVTGTGATPSTDLTYTGSFTSVKYTSGTMNVVCSSPAANGVATLKYNGTKVASNAIVAGKASFDLAGKTIHKTGMTLELPTGAGNFTATVDSSSVIEEAKGVSLPSSVLIPFKSTFANDNASDDFVDCTVGTGSLDLTIDIPKTWTNTSVEYDVELTGAINTNSVASVGNTKQVPLNGKTVTNGTTKIASNISLTFSNSDIVFANVPTISAVTNISEYASIGIVLKDVDTTVNQTEPISKEMKDMVERLILEQSGLKGTYINTFPAGNNITLLATSDFIGLNNTTATLAAAPTATAATAFSLKSDAKKTVKFRETPVAADEYSDMDFIVGIGLPGATADNLSTIRVVKVAPATTYSISIDLQPDINWESITLFSTGVKQEGFKSTGLNVNNMFKSFSDVMGSDFDGKISLKALPVAIYSVRPDLDCFTKAEFAGSMDMVFAQEQADGSIIRRDEFGVLEFMKEGAMDFVDMPVITQEEKTVVSDISKYKPSKTGDLVGICNAAKAETLGYIYVDYSLQFKNPGVSGSTFTVNYSDYSASGSKNSSIAIYAFVEVALNFNLSDDVAINLLNMAQRPADKDILGRTQAPTQSEYSEFLSAVRSVNINYTSSQVPFYAVPSSRLRLDLDGAENSAYTTKDIDLEEGTFEVTSFEKLLSLYPLIPEAYVVLYKGEFSVPREIMMKTKIALQIAMDPNNEITVWEK